MCDDCNYLRGRVWAAERERNDAIAQANYNADTANQWQRAANSWEARALKDGQIIAERDRELAVLKAEKQILQQELAKARADAAGITAKLNQLIELIPTFGANALTVFDKTFKDQAPTGMPPRPDTSFAQRAYDKAYQASLTAAGVTLTVKPPKAA